MSLTEGTQLGVYEITGQIGAGGMGEVYRATDTKLGREVAIKTLPAALASDKDRLARFEREAKLLAALNHPHIAAVHSLDEHEGTLYLAMELVEGETLEEKLKSGALPVDDALRLALQIAEALEAAHGKGVIHRDLKPANIMVNADGQVKVLDFGLAKAFSNEPEEASPGKSPALSLAMTQQGLVLGTAGYMSPEQASGQPTDQRADIWAFGVVFYEMLTGLPLFSGESVPHILADVLRAEPDWDRLPKNLHPRLQLMLERCLTKRVQERYHSIADVRVDIQAALARPDRAMPDTKSASRYRPVIGFAIGGIVFGALVIGSVTRMLGVSESVPPPVTRFYITPPPTAPLANLGGYDVIISPDGRRLAYFARELESDRVSLYVRDLDSLEARRLPGSDVEQTGGDRNPFFSRDGTWIGYYSPGQGIMRVAVSGGPPMRVAEFPGGNFLGATHASDDTIIFTSGEGLYRVSTGGGGTPERLTTETGVGGLPYIAPAILPGERAVLFCYGNESVAVLDLDTGQTTVLIEGGQNAYYSDSGHIVFARGSTLLAVPFDVDSLTLTGEPIAVAQEIRNPGGNTAADFAVAPNGTLAYVEGSIVEAVEAEVVWVNRDGQAIARVLAEPVESPRDPRLSPDGSRLVLTTGPQGDGDLWVFDLGGRPPIPLADDGDTRYGTWSPDGTEIAFSSSRSGNFELYRLPADGSVLDLEPVRPGTPTAVVNEWLADDTLILFTGIGDLVEFDLNSDREPSDVVVTLNAEYDAALSPNGRWLAYASTRTDRAEIWVKGYPDGVPVRVSTGGGREPVWSADGSELFYLQLGTMMSVPVETDGEFSFGPPVELFDGPYFWALDTYAHSYDVAADGRFLMIEQPNGQPTFNDLSSIVVVENWAEELKRLVPANRD